jgi:hypothetical protein
LVTKYHFLLQISKTIATKYQWFIFNKFFCCSCDNSSVQHWWRGWSWIPQRRFDCGWKRSPPICWKTRQLSSPQVSSWASLVTNTTGTVLKFSKSFQKKKSSTDLYFHLLIGISGCALRQKLPLPKLYSKFVLE